MMMKVKTIIPLILTLLITALSPGQEVKQYSMNLDQAMTEALNLAHEQQYAKAKVLCSKIVREEPRYFDAWLLLGNINAWEGNYNDARLFTSKLIKDTAGYAPAWILLGNSYAWEDRYDEAKSAYTTVFEFDHANKAAFLGLINLELGNSQPHSAVEICSSAIGYFPEDTDILLATARSSAMAGDIITAKKSLLLILTKDPTNEAARNLYKEVSKSVSYSYYRPGIGEDSKAYDMVAVDTLMSTARQLAWDEKYGEARFLTNQILASRPEYFPARVLNAYTYAWGNDYENARKELDRVHVEENGYRDGILAWIDTERWARNYNNALGFADLGLRFYPDDKEIILKKSEIYRDKGDYLQAKRVVYSYIIKHGQDPEMLQAYTSLVSQSNMETSNLRQDLSALTGTSLGIDSLYNGTS